MIQILDTTITESVTGNTVTVTCTQIVRIL